MIDLEERLRRDAANWHDDPPPSLDELIDELAPGNRRPQVWAVAGMAAALVVAVALAVTLWPHASLRHPASTKRSVSTTRYLPIAHVRFAAVVPDASDPRVILAMVDNSCAPIKKVRVRRLDETATAVHIVLSGVELFNPGVRGDCGGSYVPTRIQLADPLDGRRVYDGDRPRVLFDPAQAPTPTYLPKGYHPAIIRHAMSTLPDLYVSRSYVNKQAYLNIQYSVANSPSGRYVSRSGPSIDVAGHRAWFVHGSPVCLGWWPTPGLTLSVCGDTSLPDSEIVKVARGLH